MYVIHHYATGGARSILRFHATRADRTSGVQCRGASKQTMMHTLTSSKTDDLQKLLLITFLGSPIFRCPLVAFLLVTWEFVYSFNFECSLYLPNYYHPLRFLGSNPIQYNSSIHSSQLRSRPSFVLSYREGV